MRRFSRVLSVIGVAAVLAAVLPANIASARIFAPPGAPRQVITSNPTAVSMVVSWTAPLSDGGSAISDYTIGYRKAGDAAWSEFAHTPSAATSRTITGLSDTTSYEFRIAAVNINGTGPWSTSYSRISLGDVATCGFTSGGQVNCWGFDSQSYTAALSSLDGSTPSKTVDSLALGGSNGCAVLADGSAACWGANNAGQLGNGISYSDAIWTPGQVSGLDGSTPDKTVVEFSSGLPSCVILQDGSAKCWGINYNGQLGNGTTVASSVPVPVTGLDGTTPEKTPIHMAQRSSSTCAVMQDGSAACWGRNNVGQLGDGSTNDRTSPTPVSGIDGLSPATSAVSIGLQGSSTCALLEDGSVKCWGGNSQGQLGDDSTIDRRTPALVSGLDGSSPGSSVETLSVGIGGACVLLDNGATKCWGISEFSRFMSPSSYVVSPTLVGSLDGSAPDKTVLKLVVGYAHSCVLLAEGSTKCWGWNPYGQLGDGSETNSLSPVAVLESPGAFASTSRPLGATSRVSTSRAASTSMLVSWSAPLEMGGFPITNYRVRYRKMGTSAWGEFAHPVSTANSITVTGLLPETSYEFQVAAVTVLGAGPWQPTLVDVSVGAASTCAVTAGGQAECWGADDHGALGNGAGDVSRTPVPVVGIDGSDEASTAVSIGSGDAYSCAVMADSSVACWGQNGDGQLGNGSTVDSATPVRVIGFEPNLPPTRIGTGAVHSCVVIDDGNESIKCWGKNDHGQLGDGGTTSQSTPLDALGGNGYFDNFAAGRSFSCATEFGYVQCWGFNDVGQLGDGTNTSNDSGVYVGTFDGSSDDLIAASITSNGSTVCVLSEAGTVWCWGYGLQGGLGNGASRNSSVPVRVAGIDGLTPGTTAKEVASGGASTCAVMMNGAVKCWGANSKGQLGNNTKVNSSSPVAVTGLDGSTSAKSATSVAVSEAGFACAALGSGGIVCWGDNSSGQLGDGTLTDRSTPVSVARAVGTTLVGAPPATVPGAPRNFAVSVRLAETIGLAWDAPATNGGARITSYEVRWARGAQQPDVANLLEIPSDQLSTRVAGLVPGVSYTFFVKAVNSVGSGPTVRITAIVPVEAPAPVVTKVAWNSRKITLNWLGVKTPSHSPVLNYVLTCEAANVIFRQSVNASARSASVIVDSDRRHGCRVSAVTDAGRGTGSDRVIVSPSTQG